MAELSSDDKNALLDILKNKSFVKDPGILRVILTRAGLQDQVDNLMLSGNPEVVILGILNFLEQYGQDEYGYEALGRFLNALTAGNYIGDVKHKSFVNNIVMKYNLVPPTTLPLPSPETSISNLYSLVSPLFHSTANPHIIFELSRLICSQNFIIFHYVYSEYRGFESYYERIESCTTLLDCTLRGLNRFAQSS